MELFIKEKKEDNYGKVMDVSSLFAAVLISMGKATKKPSGEKLGNLLWCNLSRVVIKTGEELKDNKKRNKYHIYEENSEIMRKDKVSTETAYMSPIKNSVIFRYENINDVEEINEGTTYVVNEQPLINVLKANHLWKKDWDQDTFITAECIEQLNNVLYYNYYTQNMNKNKEIIV